LDGHDNKLNQSIKVKTSFYSQNEKKNKTVEDIKTGLGEATTKFKKKTKWSR
jgi:hypothetical protein